MNFPAGQDPVLICKLAKGQELHMRCIVRKVRAQTMQVALQLTACLTTGDRKRAREVVSVLSRSFRIRSTQCTEAYNILV